MTVIHPQLQVCVSVFFAIIILCPRRKSNGGTFRSNYYYRSRCYDRYLGGTASQKHRGVFVRPFCYLLLLNKERFNLKIPRNRHFRGRFSAVHRFSRRRQSRNSRRQKPCDLRAISFRRPSNTTRDKTDANQYRQSAPQLCPSQNIDCVSITLQSELL